MTWLEFCEPFIVAGVLVAVVGGLWLLGNAINIWPTLNRIFGHEELPPTRPEHMSPVERYHDNRRRQQAAVIREWTEADR